MKQIIVFGAGMLIACSAAFAQVESSKEVTVLEKSQHTSPTNTSKNVRDRNHWKLTAQDQSGAKSDIEITKNLRKAIMAKKGLSTDALNIKIITVNEVLTLRGPVDSEREKELIGAMAKQSCGVRKYTNQLEVKGHNNQ
jgi:osmotically-inducible protein OsmY